jgi:hypothetical protein
VSLGSPALGIAVEGLFGVDATGSRTLTDPETLRAASSEIPAVSSLSSDGWIFSAGLHLDRTFKRAFLQDASYVSIGDNQLVRTARKTSLMLRVERNEAARCSYLLVERFKDSPDGAPYAVRAAVQEVFLDGQRVPFTVDGAQIVFPSGDQLGSGCRETSGSALESDLSGDPSDARAASYCTLSNDGTGEPAPQDGGESADDTGATDPACSVVARSPARVTGFLIVLSSAIAALLARRRRRS